MSSSGFLAALLAVLAITSSTSSTHDDDFNFDSADDIEVELGPLGSFPVKPQKLNDITTTSGRIFHLAIPVEAFGKNVESYEAKKHDGKPLPSWLLFDKISGVFWGVPTEDDIGVLHLKIKSHGSHSEIVSEEFKLTIKEAEDEAESLEQCPQNEDITVLTLLIDKSVKAIKPKQRVVAINNIAKFFGLPYSAFTLVPLEKPDNIADKSVILAGPGNLHSRTSQETSLLQVTVGCDGRLWLQTAPMVHQLKQQARDGTISEVMRLPLIGWRVKTEARLIRRNRREVDYGSGDYDGYYDEYEEENYEDDFEDDVDKKTDHYTTSTTKKTVSSTSSLFTTPATSETHPHRHHHGEVKLDEADPSIPIARDHINHELPVSTTETKGRVSHSTVPMSPSTSTTAKHAETTTDQGTTFADSSVSTTTTTTETPVTEVEIVTHKISHASEVHGTTYDDKNDDDEEYDEYDDDDDIESETIVPEINTKPKTVGTDSSFEITTSEGAPSTIDETIPPIGETETTLTTVKEIPIIDLQTTSLSTTTSSSSIKTETSTATTTQSTSTTEKPKTTEEETTTVKQTTVRHITSTPKITTTPQITEVIEYDVKNFPPTIQNRLQRIPVTAGKVFSYFIPPDTFTDIEDGNNLTLEFLDSNGQPIKKNSWCQFNPITKEIYGLPLDEDVSRWEYIITASDRENSSVTDRLEILVQQHKAKRVVNHEFSLYIRIENHKEFPHSIDWSLRTLRAISALYRSNISDITVRSVNYTSDPVIFTWTNDSLPTNYCPKNEIEKLFNILTANDRGDPSLSLSHALAPELRVKKVVYQGLGVCEPQWQTPVTPPTNFSPILRNPVDHINATVGELLTFRVPDDTFYDPEDVDARTLNISLLTADRQSIPSDHWLQFDSINKEFYGIPKKAGRNEYQLVCRDSGGLPAVDSLEVVVYPAPKVQSNLDISMTLETSYDTFAYSANMQRKFVEKLKELFGDRNTSFIHLYPLKESMSNTVVTWFNKTLNLDKCPYEDISRIEAVLKNNDRTVASRVHSIMDPEFPVSTIKFKLHENCKNKPKYKSEVVDVVVPVADETQTTSNSEEYLITFIVPAVIISVMLLLAGVAACVLYRRRRTGKMNVEEDGRQSYGNKGIPVIFQEELDEKPESGTKAPVILKDEKPPLAPPEYSKSGSLKLNDDSEPYQPPPPFTRTQDNNRQSRPKPTPTYRKPPPYVPP